MVPKIQEAVCQQATGHCTCVLCSPCVTLNGPHDSLEFIVMAGLWRGNVDFPGIAAQLCPLVTTTNSAVNPTMHSSTAFRSVPANGAVRDFGWVLHALKSMLHLSARNLTSRAGCG